MSAIGNDVPENNGQGVGNESGNGFDFERSYNQLRPEYTRATQQLSEAEQRLSEYEAFMQAISDPETQADALASLGFEMDTGGELPDEFADPLEQEVQHLRSVVEQLQGNAELEAATQEEQQIFDARDAYIGSTLDYIEDATQMKFDEEEEEILGNLAIAMSDENGIPDVEGAYNALYGEQGLLERRRQQWIDSKAAAFSAPLGTTIPSDKRPQTRAERVDYVDQRLQALDRMQ